MGGVNHGDLLGQPQGQNRGEVYRGICIFYEFVLVRMGGQMGGRAPMSILSLQLSLTLLVLMVDHTSYGR